MSEPREAPGRPGARFILLAVLCILLWASAIPCVKLGYPLFGIEDGSAFDRILFAGVRFTGAGVLTLGFSLLGKKRSLAIAARHVLPVMGLGLILTTAQYILFYIGLANCLGTRSSILNAMSTFFTVFLAALLIRGERITSRKLLGCLLGMAGVAAASFAGAGGGFTWNGDLLILLASLSFSLGTVLGKKLTVSESPTLVTGYQLLFGGGVLTLIGLLGGGALRTISARGLLLLIYLMCLSAAAFSIWARLMRDHPAASVSVYFFLLPIFGVFLSGLLLGERAFTLLNLISLALVSLGIYIVNGGFSARTKAGGPGPL